MNWRQRWQLAVRRLKRSIEWAIYGLFDKWILRSQNIQTGQNCTAIIHLELLGDAVIWMPYGRALVRHLRTQGRAVVLVVDASLIPVFAPAFPGVRIVPFDRRGALKNWGTRKRVLLSLRSLAVTETFQTSSPRDGLLQDAAVRAIGAPAWGFAAAYQDRPWFDRRLSNRLYTHQVSEQIGVHQNLRHKAFLQAVGIDVFSVRPADFGSLPPCGLSGSYWVLAPGASKDFRRWAPERFAQIAQRLARRRPDWQCVVVGSAKEAVLAQQVIRVLGENVLDLTGRTDLPNLVAMIAQARLVLGNDSAAGHIAAAVGTPSVVVVGGGHWGRCYPYDPTEAPVRMLPRAVGYPMPCFGCDWICRYASRLDRPFPCIEGVDVDAVWRQVECVLAPTQVD